MIKLRALEQGDLPLLKTWRNSETVKPYVREYRFLSDMDQQEWFDSYRENRRISDWDSELMVIEDDSSIKGSVTVTGVEGISDFKYIGNVVPIGIGGFTRVEWRNRKAEFTFYIGDNEHRTEETILKSIHELLSLGFNVFNFHKIYWPVYSHDPGLSVYTKVFNEEARLKEEYFWNGKFQDRIYLSILSDEFALGEHPVLYYNRGQENSLSRSFLRKGKSKPKGRKK